jgi:hypothetical protein
MTEVADFKAITDGTVTVPPNRSFPFTLPSDVINNAETRAVLSWVMAASSPSGGEIYSLTLNGANVQTLATPPDSGRRAMHEVTDVKAGANNLEVAFVSGSLNSTVAITDLVVWFHRSV